MKCAFSCLDSRAIGLFESTGPDYGIDLAVEIFKQTESIEVVPVSQYQSRRLSSSRIEKMGVGVQDTFVLYSLRHFLQHDMMSHRIGSRTASPSR
jgi:hypothetical protein